MAGWVAVLAAVLRRQNRERFERARFMALEDAPRVPAPDGGRDD
jgi:cbb3-type cytochrome oxidase subunit 3